MPHLQWLQFHPHGNHGSKQYPLTPSSQSHLRNKCTVKSKWESLHYTVWMFLSGMKISRSLLHVKCCHCWQVSCVPLHNNHKTWIPKIFDIWWRLTILLTGFYVGQTMLCLTSISALHGCNEDIFGSAFRCTWPPLGRPMVQEFSPFLWLHWKYI